MRFNKQKTTLLSGIFISHHLLCLRVPQSIGSILRLRRLIEDTHLTLAVISFKVEANNSIWDYKHTRKYLPSFRSFTACNSLLVPRPCNGSTLMSIFLDRFLDWVVNLFGSNQSGPNYIFMHQNCKRCYDLYTDRLSLKIMLPYVSEMNFFKQIQRFAETLSKDCDYACGSCCTPLSCTVLIMECHSYCKHVD